MSLTLILTHLSHFKIRKSSLRPVSEYHNMSPILRSYWIFVSSLNYYVSCDKTYLCLHRKLKISEFVYIRLVIENKRRIHSKDSIFYFGDCFLFGFSHIDASTCYHNLFSYFPIYIFLKLKSCLPTIYVLAQIGPSWVSRCAMNIYCTPLYSDKFTAK